jgi:hypothetical protein
MMFAGVMNAEYKVGDIYCPILQNARWVYTVHHKKNLDPPYDRTAEITGNELYDGLDYFSYYSPDSDAKYLIRKDDSGLYIKAARYAVPFLSFFHFDIIFDPPVYAIKFPMTKGDTWHYEGIASIKALGIFNFPTKVWAKCTHMGIEVIEAAGRTMPAYKLYAELNRDGMDKTFKASFWFGEGVGLAGYESENNLLTLKSFEIKPDAAPNTVNAVEKK